SSSSRSSRPARPGRAHSSQGHSPTSTASSTTSCASQTTASCSDGCSRQARREQESRSSISTAPTRRSGTACRAPLARKEPDMSVNLQARTREGAELVAIAEELAAAIAPAAAVHDREGTFPFEGLQALKGRGYLVAPVPAELGGLGVTSVHDLVLA